MAKKTFGVRVGYVWIDRKGLPQADLREVTIDEDGPEYEAQKHKLEPLDASRKHWDERDARVEAARSAVPSRNRMIQAAPAGRKVGAAKKDGKGEDE